MRCAAALALAALAACGADEGPGAPDAARARALLQDAADGLVFHRLDPNPQVPEARGNRPALHGWTVLESRKVADSRLAARVRSALSDPETYGDRAVPCFRPGLAFTFEGARPVDFVVCLECSRIEGYRDGKEAGTLLLSAAGNERLLAVYRTLAP